jgi:hypothetical protein
MKRLRSLGRVPSAAGGAPLARTAHNRPNGPNPVTVYVAAATMAVADNEAKDEKAAAEAMTKEATDKEAMDKQATKEAATKEATDKKAVEVAADKQAMEEAAAK